jgi:hypothetical protein
MPPILFLCLHIPHRGYGDHSLPVSGYAQRSVCSNAQGECRLITCHNIPLGGYYSIGDQLGQIARVNELPGHLSWRECRFPSGAGHSVDGGTRRRKRLVSLRRRLASLRRRLDSAGSLVLRRRLGL